MYVLLNYTPLAFDWNLLGNCVVPAAPKILVEESGVDKNGAITHPTGECTRKGRALVWRWCPKNEKQNLQESK
jgi:hypothetical protein